MTVLADRGVAVISIDTELAWGDAHRRDAVAPAHDYDAERGVVADVLAVLAHHGIPATWAIVGHLLLDRCAAVDGRPHPEVVRPAYDWLDEDWLAVDPCSSLAEAPWYYGRDIVEAVRACPVRQEIGCHSFSHLIAGDPGCSREAFASDLAACRSLATADGIELRSFVFPRNAVGHVELLAANGFACYRGRADAAGRAGAGPAARFADRIRPTAASAVTPCREAGGVWNLPQTYLFAPATNRRRLPIGWWVRRPVARLRLAARERSLFHLWFHPYNLTAAPERARRGLDAICAELARLRDAGRLDVLTMGELADRLEAGAS